MPAPHIDLICKHTKVLPFEDALACHMPLIECQSVNLSFMLRPPRKAASSPRPLPSLKRRVSSRYAQNGCRKSLRERRRSRFVALSALTQAGYPSQPQGSKRFGWTGTESMNEWGVWTDGEQPLASRIALRLSSFSTIAAAARSNIFAVQPHCLPKDSAPSGEWHGDLCWENVSRSERLVSAMTRPNPRSWRQAKMAQKAGESHAVLLSSAQVALCAPFARSSHARQSVFPECFPKLTASEAR